MQSSIQWYSTKSQISLSSVTKTRNIINTGVRANTKFILLSETIMLKTLEEMHNITISILKPTKIFIHKQSLESLELVVADISWNAVSPWHIGLGRGLLILCLTLSTVRYIHRFKVSKKSNST